MSVWFGCDPVERGAAHFIRQLAQILEQGLSSKGLSLPNYITGTPAESIAELIRVAGRKIVCFFDNFPLRDEPETAAVAMHLFGLNKTGRAAAPVGRRRIAFGC